DDMKRLRTILVALAGLSALALGAWWWSRLAPVPLVLPDDPRLDPATPYRNVRPGVNYMGDDACARCHARIAGVYARHPMSRSLTPVAERAAVERFGDEAHNPFERRGFHFEVERRGNRMVHRESRAAADGEAIRLEAEVHFAVGSGTRGRTYLVERGGHY